MASNANFNAEISVKDILGKTVYVRIILLK